MRQTLLAFAIVTLGLVVPARAADVLDARDIKRVVSAHTDEIGKCYRKLGMKSRNATGKLVLEFVVDRDGTVTRASSQSPGVRGVHKKRLDRCITARVKKWKFPRSKSATEVEYPFTFHFYSARR